MRLASFLGTEEFFLVFMPAVYWCWNTGLGFRLGLMLTASSGLADCLKVAFHSPRPYWVSQDVNAWSSEPSFGLPSAHAQNSVAFWGLLASYFGSRRAMAAAMLLAILIGISRIHLGVHFAQDVVAGWGMGLLILGAFLFGERCAGEKLAAQDMRVQILISMLASLCLMGLYALIRAAIDGWQMPVSWEALSLLQTGSAPDPLNPKIVLTSAGMLFGLGAGFPLMRRKLPPWRPGSAGRRAACYLLGMIGLLLIWYGMGELGHGQTALLAGGVYYLRSAVAGLWVSVLAPALFIRMGLTERI